VRVERERPVLDARHRQPTGFVSDVRAGDTGHALETLCELLSRTAAVRVQQYGGLGAFATVSLRGAPPSQLSVYLDGVPLTSAAGTIVNFSDIPVTAVDRLGFRLRIRSGERLHGVRIAFPREVTTAAESRSVLIEMLAQVRAAT